MTYPDRLPRPDLLSRLNLRVTEVEYNPDVQISTALVKWGEKIPADHLPQQIGQHLVRTYQLDEIPKVEIPGKTGFDHHYWTGSVDYQELCQLQIEASAQALLAALRPQNLIPSQLTRIAIATSIPASPDLAAAIAEKLGVQPKKVDLCVGACFSSGYMFAKFIKEANQNPPGPQAVVGIESVTALREPITGGPDYFQRGIKDIASLSFFSDMAGATVFDSTKFRLLQETPLGIQDPGALGCVRVIPIQNMTPIPGYNGVLLEKPRLVAATIPDEHPNTAVFMDPGATTRFFVTYLKKLADNFKSDYRQTFGNEFDAKDISAVMCHHPSRLLHEFIATKQLGLPPYLAPFVSAHCNSPAVTFHMEAARVLPHLQPEKKLMTIFFGAGVAGSINVYRLQL